MNNSIRTEWENMRCFPIFEYKISENDWLVVDIQLSEDNQEIEFSFDSDNKKNWFSGEVITINENRYKITVDPDFSLDEHLQLIDKEMTEGYLLPNGLYYE